MSDIVKVATNTYKGNGLPPGLAVYCANTGGAYSKLGRTSSMEAKPSVLHFGGYKLNKKHKALLQIFNVSNESVRVTILPLQTPFFQFQFLNEKKGFIAPGMSEDIVIEFTPTEWRYYYDCVRFHCRDENIIVPIHAYPVMNDVIFTSRIDMGSRPLGVTSEITIPLECKVPIQFEYEFTVVTDHPDFELTPMKGIVPANGSIPIIIRYHPLKLCTSFMKLSLNVSQFGFKPYTVIISGSAAAGLTKQIAKNDAYYAFTQELENMNLDMPPKIPITDPAVDIISQKRRQRHERLKKLGKLPSQQKRQANEEEATVHGFRIPSMENFERGSANALNFVLTQQQGRMKPKDLQFAIAKQRKLREEQEIATKKMREAMDKSDVSDASLPPSVIIAAERGDGADETRQLREIAFLQDMANIEKVDQAREFQSVGNHIGEPLLTSKEIFQVRQARQQRRRKEEQIMQKEARDATETQSLGPYQIPETRVEILAEIKPTFEPTFDQYQNDVWSMRKQVLKRFSHLITKVCVRKRSDERTAAIFRRLGDTPTKESVAAFVDWDNKQKRVAVKTGAPNVSSGDNVEGETVKTPLVIQREGPPDEFVASESGGASNTDSDKKVKGGYNGSQSGNFDSRLAPFHEYAYFRLKEPQEYVEKGYTEIPIPALQKCIPLTSRRVEQGAAEESGGLLTREEVEESFRTRNIHNRQQSNINDDGIENVATIEMYRRTSEEEETLEYIQMPQAKAAGLLEIRRELPAFARFPEHLETEMHYPLRAVSNLRDQQIGTANEAVEVCKEASLSFFCSIWRTHHRPQMLSTLLDDKVPHVLHRALDEDDLSDSDTDSEDDIGQPLSKDELLLTPSLARSLYENVSPDKLEGHSSIIGRVRTPGSVEPNSAAAAAKEHKDRDDEMNRSTTAFDVIRDQALLRIASDQRERRLKTVDMLPEDVFQFSKVLKNPRVRHQVTDAFKVSGYIIS